MKSEKSALYGTHRLSINLKDNFRIKNWTSTRVNTMTWEERGYQLFHHAYPTYIQNEMIISSPVH
jgi:hypothetical protein